MNPQMRYLARQEVSLGDEGEEGALLFNADTGNVMLVNPTGRMVWQFLDEPRSRDEIAAHLAEQCEGVTQSQAAQDLEPFLERLLPEYIEEVAPHGEP